MIAQLFDKAHEFADTIAGILNGTICNGVVIRAVLDPRDGTRVIAGNGLSHQNPLVAKPFPVRLGQEKPRCWLNLSYRLCLDETRSWLTVVSSIGVFVDEDCQVCLCHFDYERGKGNGYPEAHLQIHGFSPALDVLRGRGASVKALDKLHFPVGGRRFRPSLEDVIEFLVVEQLVQPRTGWQRVVEQGREKFQEIQLAAAIRRHPDIARRVLSEMEGAN